MTENILRINSDIFISLWNEFSQQFTSENSEWQVLWDSDFLWSKKFLGGKKSSSETSPIGQFFQEKFQDIRYRTEDGSFDLAFSFAPNYAGIPYINRNKIDHFNLDDQFYPAAYDIIVEIENGCNYAWHEMTKLTWVRCPLKVLITYNGKWSNENEMLVLSFSTIISQSNKNFKDNLATEYLLLVGNKTTDNKLEWKHFKFDSNGKVV